MQIGIAVLFAHVVGLSDDAFNAVPADLHVRRLFVLRHCFAAASHDEPQLSFVHCVLFLVLIRLGDYLARYAPPRNKGVHLSQLRLKN